MRRVEINTFGVETIGVIRSCFTEKFGIPRQAGLVSTSRASIHLVPPYNRQEMVKGLDQFSHIWVHFLFHDTVKEGWKCTVRPPGLGGHKRVGVFASRSPHRPNHLGLSAVRLVGIDVHDKEIVLEVAGGDFLDATPVIDIKPYLPYSDGIDNAEGGYSGCLGAIKEVVFSHGCAKFCSEYREGCGRDIQPLITQVLLQDPRPASQRKGKVEFGMMLWDVNIRWRVEDNVFVVTECRYV